MWWMVCKFVSVLACRVVSLPPGYSNSLKGLASVWTLIVFVDCFAPFPVSSGALSLFIWWSSSHSLSCLSLNLPFSLILYSLISFSLCLSTPLTLHPHPSTSSRPTPLSLSVCQMLSLLLYSHVSIFVTMVSSSSSIDPLCLLWAVQLLSLQTASLSVQWLPGL